MSVHIVTDSASDLPKDLVAERGITVVPLTVRFGDDREIVDGSITPDDFWARCNSSAVLPQTSAPSAGDFEEAFRKAAAAGADAVVCVTLASGLSATFSSASAAAASVKDDLAVRVVDSRTASLGEGLITLAAADSAASGAGIDEVEAATRNAADRTKVFAALDTLEFLKKGGRIGGAQAFLGSLLSIKPIIEVGNGKVEPESKQRTRTRAMQYLADKVKAAGPLERLAVVHGRAPDVDEFTDLLEDSAPNSGIMVSDVGAVIGAHSGPRLLGVTSQPPDGDLPAGSRSDHIATIRVSDATQEFGAENHRGAAPGDLVDGRYRLEEALGGGVTATTWRAHDPVLGRDVAVKIWSDASDDAHRSQQDELGAARLLDPNLNELLDAGSHDGRPFLVREIAAEHPAIPAGPPSAPVPSTPAPASPPTTPAAGTPAVRARRRPDRVVVTSVTAIVLAALLVGVGLMVRPDSGEPPGEGEGSSPVMPAEVISFDPEGDGRENSEDLGALLDGDPQTAWNSDRYNSRKFGNLKPGLGLIVALSPARKIAQLEVLSQTGGWSAQVHAAEAPAEELGGWGAPIDRVDSSAASERFDLGGRTVGAVLIWFTDLGPESNRLTISEIRLLSSQ